jgi:hypothetical protein
MTIPEIPTAKHLTRPRWQPHRMSWLCVYVYLLREREWEAAKVVLRVIESQIESGKGTTMTTLGERLRQQPATRILVKPTLAQRAILNLLESGRGSIMVHGAYIGDVLALECQGVVTGELVDGMLKVQLRTDGQFNTAMGR